MFLSNLFNALPDSGALSGNDLGLRGVLYVFRFDTRILAPISALREAHVAWHPVGIGGCADRTQRAHLASVSHRG